MIRLSQKICRTGTLIGAAFMLSALPVTAQAKSIKSQKFETSITAPLTQSVKIEVSLSEDLAWRANNLPRKLKDRGSSAPRRLNAGFSQNGFYGEADLERLQEKLKGRMNSRLNKAGIEVSETAPTTLKLVLVDARPNRPTPEQLSRDISLTRLGSVANGGARFEGEMFDASGQSLGTLSFAFYERDFEEAAFSAVWTDVHRAIDRFTRRAAKQLTSE